MLVLIMQPNPIHRTAFIAAFRGQVEQIMGAAEKIDPTGIGGIGVEDFSLFIF